MNLTVEQFEQILTALQSSNGSNSAVLIFTGILTVCGLVALMWWMLNMRLGPLERLTYELKDTIVDLDKRVQEMDKKIWDPSDLDNKLKVACTEMIQAHIKSCPYHCPLNDKK